MERFMVNINQLSKPCISRARGNEAGEKIAQLIDQYNSLEIDLQGVELISLSYLDGIITRLLVSNNLEKVIFVTNERQHLDKLSQISSLRGISIYHRTLEKQPQIVTPKRQPPTKLVYVEHK